MAAVVLCVSGVIVACSTEDKAKETKVVLDDTVVLYVDLAQLGNKSAINEILTDGNRSLLATVLTAECDNPEWTDYTAKLLANLSVSGLDTKTPVYGYYDIKDAEFEAEELVLVAKVADAKAVDRFVEYMSELSGEDIEVVKDGDLRKFTLEDELYCAYNTKRFVAVASEEYLEDAESVIKRALERPEADLSAYEK